MLRGSVTSRALDPGAPFALAAIFLRAGFLWTIWIDLDFAAFEFRAAEIDRRVDSVLDFDHFHEAEASGTASDFVGYHQGAADAAYFGEERAKIIARNGFSEISDVYSGHRVSFTEFARESLLPDREPGTNFGGGRSREPTNSIERVDVEPAGSIAAPLKTTERAAWTRPV